MKKFLFLFTCIVNSVFAIDIFETLDASFNMPSTVCKGQNINITNTTLGSSKQEWNVCKGNGVGYEFTPVSLGSFGGQLNLPNEMDIVFDGTNYIGIVTNYNTTSNNVLRFNFGNSILNTPTIQSLNSIISPIVNTRPTAVDVIKDTSGNWFAFLVFENTTNGGQLIKLNFGSSLTNNPTITNLGSFSMQMFSYDLTIVKDGINYFGFLGGSNSGLKRLNFGNTLSNTPTMTDLGNFGFLSDVSSISIKKIRNNWIMFVTNIYTAPTFANSIVKFNFGSSLTNTPIVNNLGSFQMTNPIVGQYFIDCGVEKLLVIENSPTNKITELVFPNNIENNLVYSNKFGNYSNLGFSGKNSEIFLTSTNKKVFLTQSGTNNSLIRIEFDKCNNAGIPRSTTYNPPTFKLDTAGIYVVSLTIDKGLPTENEICKEISVLNCLVNPNFTVPDTVCKGQNINISNTTQGASTQEWNICKSSSSSNIYTSTNIGNPGALLDYPTELDIVFDGTNYIGLICNYNTGANKVVRVNFGNSITNTPTSTNLTSVISPIVNSRPTAVSIEKDGNNWYAFVIYENTSFGGQMIRLNFGSSLTNTPTATNLGSFGLQMYTFDMEIVKDNGNFFGFLAVQGNGLLKFSFGNSLANIPTVTNLGAATNTLNQFGELKLINYKNKWLLFFGTSSISSNPNHLIRFDFGTSLNNIPQYFDFGSINMTNPFLGSYFRECGTDKLFITENLGSNRLFTINFTNGLDGNVVTYTDLGNNYNFALSGISSEVFLLPNGKRAFITQSASNDVLMRVEYEKCNNAGIPRSTAFNPPVFKLDTPGIYTISLTLDKTLSTENEICKQIVVLDSTTKPNAYSRNNICIGDTVRLNISNITPNTRYNWTGPNGFNASIANPIVNNFSSTGTYIVTATGRCGIKKDTLLITANNLQVNLGADKQICTGTSTTLNAGIAGATYQWNTGATTQTISVSSAGTYSVLVTQNNCSDRDTVIVTTISNPNAGSNGSTTVCDNSQIAINLFSLISGEQTGGTWARISGAGGTFNAGAGTFTPSIGATNSQFRYIVAASGCPSDTSIATVNISNAVNAGADGFISVCESSTATIDLRDLITGEQTGGTWTRASGSGGTFNAGAGTFTPSLGTTSSIFVYTILGVAPCSNDQSNATVNITATPNANAGTDKNISCTNPTAQLQGTSSTNGVSFSWTGNGIISGGNTATPTVNAAGTYTLTVTVLNSTCSATDFAIVTSNTTAPNANAGEDKILSCSITSLNLSGSSTTSGVNFSWAGSGIVSGANTATPTVNAAGTYTLTVTNPSNGCTATDIVVVANNANTPNANAGSDKVITCSENSTQLIGTSTTAGVSFSWTGSGIVSGGNTASPTVNAAGTYTLTVTNPNNGCSNTDVAVVSIANNLQVNLGADKQICTGTSTTLDAGIAGVTYLWNTGATTQTISVSTAGTYSVLVTQNNCSDRDTVIVTIISNPNANAGEDKIITCINPTVQLQGSSSTNGVSFSWTGNGIVSGGNTATPTVNAAGTYTLTVTVQNSTCSATDFAIVTSNTTAPNANAGEDKILSCSITSLNLSGSSTTSGVNFSWAGSGIVSGANTATPTVNAAGTYTLTVTNPSNGCTATDIVVVANNANTPNANAGSDKVITCSENSTQLIGTSTTAGVSFSWTGSGIVSGGNTASPTVNAAGTYTLTVTNPNNGCNNTDVAVVSIANNLQVNLGADKQICTGTSTTLDASIVGVTYLWNTGATTQTISVSTAGTYSVLVTQNNCSGIDTVLVNNILPPNQIDLGKDTLVCNASTFTLSTGLSNTLWSNGQIGASISVVNSGQYIATISNSCGSTSDSINVNFASTFKPTLGDDKIICIGDSITLTIPNGNYTVQWSNQESGNSITIFEPGIYEVSVTNICGIAKDTIEINTENCEQCIVKVPNAFSPNGDKENDLFRPVYRCKLDNYKFIVANRWGEVVFHTDIGNGEWDGTFKGKPAASDSYGWYLEYIDPNDGVKKTLQGNVLLIR
jgi:gliding motility-associated-like protein